MDKPVQQLISVQDWVNYIQTLHSREIEMGLDRTRDVYKRLLPSGFNPTVISVAGTNGKGSTAEILSACYSEGGYSVGKYTSPHLLRFNERIEINRQPVSDATLLDAFAAVELARRDTALTYFEFGTLVAIYIMQKSGVDVAVMEVGLGGRLDAVNILDSELSIITSISIDHTAWLGSTLEAIAFEKAGITRSERPVVTGTQPILDSLIQACSDRGALIYQLGREFSFVHNEQSQMWHWEGQSCTVSDIDVPFGMAGVQLHNASCAVQALLLLDDTVPISHDAIRSGIKTAKVRGRCQVVSKQPLVVLDVAHNEDSVRALSGFIKSLEIEGRVKAVCGMLRDKQIAASLSNIAPLIDEWYLASILGERGSTAASINEIVHDLVAAKETVITQQFESVEAAFKVAREHASSTDCVVVFGSFYIVADILKQFE